MSQSSRSFSRRAFMMAASGALAAGLGLPGMRRRSSAAPAADGPFAPPLPDEAELSFIQPRPARIEQWGRITHYGSRVDSSPTSGELIGWLPQDRVLPILEVAEGTAKNRNNPTWYRVPDGWVYTADLQIIRPYHMPTEIRDIPTKIANVLGEEVPGFWGEIVVPFTTARQGPSGLAAPLIDGSTMVLYYGSVHRVVEAKPDDAGFLWYKVADDRKGADPYYVLARHMRMITEQDLEPINPGADKRIEVSLAAQRIDCYEDDRIVFSTMTSSGGEGFGTPKGNHAVVYKQPSRHMYSDPESEAFSDPNYFDLPGVPFNIFLTTLGHAIHGTFWHGDFGRPRSHGCLNVTPEAARWLFRWTEPVHPYSALASGSASEPGTPIIVS